jgi:hypothetical protein
MSSRARRAAVLLLSAAPISPGQAAAQQIEVVNHYGDPLDVHVFKKNDWPECAQVVVAKAPSSGRTVVTLKPADLPDCTEADAGYSLRIYSFDGLSHLYTCWVEDVPWGTSITVRKADDRAEPLICTP